MTVGQRIKQCRIALGVTQEELAKKMGTSKQNISRYENDGVKDIPMKTLARIADALQTTPADILGFNETGTISVYVYDQHDREVKQKRMGLHQLIDEAPEELLDVMEMLLSLPQERLQALATLTGIQVQDKDS